ncbi:MAG: zinc-regulated TonB-dependent outer membrane receptor, partial [Myxococcota bacterium]
MSVLLLLLAGAGVSRAEDAPASEAGDPPAPSDAPSDPPPADPPPAAPTAEDLAAIEAALAKDAEAAALPAPPTPTGAIRLQSLNPDIAFIGDIAFAYFTADEPLQMGGHDPTANGFTLQQLELSVSKSVDPYFRFDSNIVFSLEGVEVEEVYATTLALPGRLQ